MKLLFNKKKERIKLKSSYRVKCAQLMTVSKIGTEEIHGYREIKRAVCRWISKR